MMKNVKLVIACAVCLSGLCFWNGHVIAEDGTADRSTEPEVFSAALGATDMAFDRYVDIQLVAYAWDTLNSELLTDVALQMLEGERVLRRPNRVISAEQLVNTAVKVAIDNHDEASVERLLQAATDSGRGSLSDSIALSQKLMAGSRDTQSPGASDLKSLSVEQLQAQKLVSSEIDRAKLTGANDVLATIEKDLAATTVLTDQQRKDLMSQLQAAKSSILQSTSSNDADRETLDKLTGAARQWNVPGPMYYPPYFPPQNTQTWLRNPWDPGANIAIPWTNRNFSNYVPGVGWVSGNQYIGIDGRPHGSVTTTNPWGGSNTTLYYKKR